MASGRDDLYSIGEFARRTGLTEKALRLYDRRGLLLPVEVDPETGYRSYAPDQIEEGRLVAMLRAIEMPLAKIAEVLAVPAAERSRAVGRYRYRFERDLDDYRQTVRALRGLSQAREGGMSHDNAALEEGRQAGAFAAIMALSAIDDLSEAAHAYGEAMRTAYWTDRDVPLVTAIAYAGVGRLMAGAATADPEAASEARSAAKALMYNLASFTWVGWGEPDIEVGTAEAAGGLAAARSNLAMAAELESELPISRAHWMLGAHLLTSGSLDDATRAFAEAGRYAELAGAEAEVELATAFGALADLATGHDGAAERLDAALKRLAATEGGGDFVTQVTTARGVIGV